MEIMHLDISPDNIVIDHSSKKAMLIDWGSAETYVKGKEYDI